MRLFAFQGSSSSPPLRCLSAAKQPHQNNHKPNIGAWFMLQSGLSSSTAHPDNTTTSHHQRLSCEPPENMRSGSVAIGLHSPTPASEHGVFEYSGRAKPWMSLLATTSPRAVGSLRFPETDHVVSVRLCRYQAASHRTVGSPSWVERGSEPETHTSLRMWSCLDLQETGE